MAASSRNHFASTRQNKRWILQQLGEMMGNWHRQNYRKPWGYLNLKAAKLKRKKKNHPKTRKKNKKQGFVLSTTPCCKDANATQLLPSPKPEIIWPQPPLEDISLGLFLVVTKVSLKSQSLFLLCSPLTTFPSIFTQKESSWFQLFMRIILVWGILFSTEA